MNLSLVAYYGEKPAQLAEFIGTAQAELAAHLPLSFCGYTLEQVHATVISLEGYREGGEVINRNYLELHGERRCMDLATAFDLLREPCRLPLKVIVGGYREAEHYSFTSRGLHPYLRSFSIQGDIAVAMGWPSGDGKPDLSLGHLRRAFERANVLHKYHRMGDELDNDFYFVLGRIRADRTTAGELQRVAERMREFLGARAPLALTMGRDCLSVVAYIDTCVSPDSTRVFVLDAAEQQQETIRALYPDASTGY